MATFTWVIKDLEREVSTGGVTKAQWEVTGYGEGLKASSAGATYFTPDPSAPDFVPFESLTEDFVLHWVWNNEDKDAIEAAFASELAVTLTAGTATGNPWVEAE